MKRILFIYFMMVLVGPMASAQVLKVGQRTFYFEDTSRGRKLTTEVWYPTSDTKQPQEIPAIPFHRMPTIIEASYPEKPLPLILFSHGTGGGRLTVEWFCAGLAAQGFIVAAVDHYGNTFDNPIPIEFLKCWERPLDLQFVLNQFLNSEVAKVIDEKHIGAAGFSIGGFTAICLAGAKMDLNALEKYFKTDGGKKEADIPEMPGLLLLFDQPGTRDTLWRSYAKALPRLADKRIKSVFMMSPAAGQAFPNAASTRGVHVPVYIVAAGNDQIAPLETNAKHYVTLLKDAQLVIVGANAGHYIFLNEAKDGLKQQAPLFFTDPEQVSRGEVHQQVLEMAIEHFKKTL
jgi:predicted dienelactone hydrolase